MQQAYLRLNRRIRPLLWCLVIVGLFACAALAVERWHVETSADRVEIVLDEHDLQEIAGQRPDPDGFVRLQLAQMKEAGITTLSVNENSLEELELHRRIRLLTPKEAFLLDPGISPAENGTFLLFADRRAQEEIEPLIREGFSRLETKVETWNAGEHRGLKISMAPEEAKMKPLPPDPSTIGQIKEHGFEIIYRLSDRRDPFDSRDLESLLAQLSEYGVKTVLFDGETVTGFASHEQQGSLYAVAELLKKFKMNIAFIELQNKKQKGFQTLAHASGYRVIRLHSLTENETSLEPQTIADRLVLAVTDRNIRLLFLNAKVSKDPERGIMADTLDNLYKSLQGPDGAVERMKEAGYEIGQAEPFVHSDSGWNRFLTGIALVGAVAFVSLALSQFIPAGLAGFFILGLLASAGLYVLSSSWLLKIMALAVGVFAPVYAVASATRAVREGPGRNDPPMRRGLRALGTFFRISFVSLAGAAFVVGLLSHVSYLLGLDQFRGVTVLHLAPIAFSAIYLFLFSERLTPPKMAEKLAQFLGSPLNIFWFAFMLLFGAALIYYLTRTGNQGQVSEYERMFRALLEDVLGVRPRTKELISHPLMILGVYLAWKYRSAVYLFVLGVIGQLSMVNTFSHLHTPLAISAIRVLYGLIFGAILGVLLILVWEWIRRGWNRWMQPSKPL